MRTAKTLALTHDGKEILLSGKAVPIVEQLTAFRQLRCTKTHAEYAEVSYQESDSNEHLVRFQKSETVTTEPEPETKPKKSK